MAQHDYVISNQGFASYRSDHNSSLSAIVSNNSGATEPSTTYAYQWWYDETTDILKMRNADNDAWITMFTFDQTADTYSLATDVELTITENLDLTGSATISGDLTVDTDTLYVDTTNNRVGVKNASPTVELDVTGEAKISGDLTVDTDTLKVDSSNNRVGVGTASPSNPFQVGTSDLIVDSSGNLLVGATSGSSPITLQTRSGEFFQTGMQINSTNSDFSGALLDMRATSGSVNSSNGRFLRFYSDNGSTESFHIKGSGEIYTAAGILLGGTTSANLLDDYEEGTWTPLIGGSTGTGTATYTKQAGFYVKIGTMVHIQAYLDFNSGTGTGNFFIEGLPFTTKSIADNYSTVSIGYFHNISYTAGRTPMIYIDDNNSDRLLLGESNPAGAWSPLPYDGTGALIFAGTYISN